MISCQFVATVRAGIQTFTLDSGFELDEILQISSADYEDNVAQSNAAIEHTILALRRADIKARRRARRSPSGVWRCSGHILVTPRCGPSELLYLITLLGLLAEQGYEHVHVQVAPRFAFMASPFALRHIVAKAWPNLAIECTVQPND